MCLVWDFSWFAIGTGTLEIGRDHVLSSYFFTSLLSCYGWRYCGGGDLQAWTFGTLCMGG